MREVAPVHEPVRFGAFEVDFRNRLIRKHGLKIRLQDQPFRILQILLERPGELASREELQRQIWPADTFVDFEKGLNNAIKRLRETLGDSAETPRFIETIPRRGYRFIGTIIKTDVAKPIQEVDLPDEVSTPARLGPLYRWLAIGIGVLFLGFVATLFGLDIGGLRQRLLVKASSPVIHSLAVLPLANLSNDPNQEYFSDGMTDALITDLAQINSLKMISRTSSMQYKQTKKSLPEIARELNVDGIIEGTVQRSGDHVRITAQLIYGPSDKHLWANSYEREMRDVFALERDVTGDIARQVQAKLTMEKRAPLTEPRPVNPKALEAYLQGNYHLNRGSGDEEMGKAQKYFQQAVDADPKFALAYVGLAESHYALLRSSTNDRETRRASAEKAVALDPSSSDARTALGEMKSADWDWPGAEDEFRHAIVLNSNSAKAHDGLCDLLTEVGRLDESLNECQIAQELDPNNDYLSRTFEARGQFDRAIESLLRSSKSHPEDAFVHYFLFRDYGLNGMYKESIYELEQSLTLVGFSQWAADVHRVYTASGYRGALQQWAKDLEHLHATNKVFLPRLAAEVYARLGDKDRAFYWLEQAYEHHDLIGEYGGLESVKIEHDLDPLRSDPRYKDLLRRIGLPQ